MFEEFYNLAHHGINECKEKYSPIELGRINTNAVYYFMTQVMLGKNIDLALDIAQSSGVLEYIIPGLDGVVQLRDDKNRFKALWPHTMQVVRKSKPTIEIRSAALFHDFGKPATLKFEDDKVTFYKHEGVSVKYFVNFASKWRIYSKDQFNKIKFLIRNLGWVESYSSDWTDSAVRRFYKTAGDNLDDLIELSRADVTSANPMQHQRVNDNIDHLKGRIVKLKEQDNQKPLLPKGLGDALIAAGVNYGPKVGKIKTNLEEEIKKGDLQAYQNIEYYINVAKNRKWL